MLTTISNTQGVKAINKTGDDIDRLKKRIESTARGEAYGTENLSKIENKLEAARVRYAEMGQSLISLQGALDEKIREQSAAVRDEKSIAKHGEEIARIRSSIEATENAIKEQEILIASTQSGCIKELNAIRLARLGEVHKQAFFVEEEIYSCLYAAMEKIGDLRALYGDYRALINQGDHHTVIHNGMKHSNLQVKLVNEIPSLMDFFVTEIQDKKPVKPLEFRRKLR